MESMEDAGWASQANLVAPPKSHRVVPYFSRSSIYLGTACVYERAIFLIALLLKQEASNVPAAFGAAYTSGIRRDRAEF